MSKFARVENGVVVETALLENGAKISEAFHPDLASQFVGCPDDVSANWIFDGKNFCEPDTPQPTQSELRAYAAMRRYSIEIGGIEQGGMRIDTGRDSQNMIANAHAYVENSGAESVKFKSGSGWLDLSTAEIKSIALAVGAHVQACFDAEAIVDEKISSGELVDFPKIDQAFAGIMA